MLHPTSKNKTSVVGNQATFLNNEQLIAYNSAKHILASINKKASSGNSILTIPRIVSPTEVLNTSYVQKPSYFNTSENAGFTTQLIKFNSSNFNIATTKVGYGTYDGVSELKDYALIVDVKRNPISSEDRYGGTSEYALKSNRWIPCGSPVNLTSDTEIELKYLSGDTYIHRYDLLRIYPEKVTQPVRVSEIISFLVESFVNLDGRFDENRRNTNSDIFTPDTYGLINSIYSQTDNYFNYRILDSDLFSSKEFPSMIAWTSPKIGISMVDTWTNVNVINSIMLDGSHGGIMSIDSFANELYAFQKTGVARVLYNEKTMTKSNTGQTIELANSYTIPSFRYVSLSNGCQFRLNTVTTKGGIIFIDSNDESINILAGEQIANISTAKGMASFALSDMNKDGDNSICYDKRLGDIYFNSKASDYSLSFNEQVTLFTSFYSHEDIEWMHNTSWDFYPSNSLKMA